MKKIASGAPVVLQRMTRIKQQPPRLRVRTMPKGTFCDSVFTNDSGSLRYKVYVPSTVPRGALVPLVVMLHGCTQSAADFALGTRMNEIADQHGFLVVYPEQSDSGNEARCWNWFRPEHQLRDQGEPCLIAGITREVMDAYPIDPSRVFVAGLSAGGAMAIIIGTTYPDLFAAVGVHSGVPYGIARDSFSAYSAMKGGSGFTGPLGMWASLFGPSHAGPDSSLPTIVFHGSIDDMVDFHNAELIVEHATAVIQRDSPLTKSLTEGTVSGGRYTQSVFSDDADHAIVEQWVLHDQGHAWSGGDASGSYAQAQGPDASAQMIRFFAAVPPRQELAAPPPRVTDALGLYRRVA